MSWFSKLNPTPVFPDYTGPYKVGSVDVEIPVTELDAPSPAPDSSIGTVAFRIFYPSESASAQRPVRWLPSPQRGHLSAYARFLGANPSVANIFSLLPQHLYYISIPVQRNAPLLPTDESARWPVMVFSHGLGGYRNAYSHLCGSIASHGVVVIAPDHRDGSAPVAYIRATEGLEAKMLTYISLPHEATPEVYKARDKMLGVRLWELGLIHDALLKIDEGKTVKNLDPNSVQSRKKDVNDVLSMFKGRLDLHQPGAIAWAGHSFGGATMHQFVKSVYYRPDSEKAGYTPLFTPSPTSEIVKQITPSSMLILLDMWCLPLKSPSTSWLWKKPLPCYSPSGPGGKAVIAICSEGFFKWKKHLSETKHALSEAPASDTPPHTKPLPYFFYPVHSAHLSQSDFGILFPWMTKKMFNSIEPEWTMELNVRAILQFLREGKWKIADTLLPAEETHDQEITTTGSTAPVAKRGSDPKILHPDSKIKNWIFITTDQGTPDLIKREDSPEPGAVQDVVQREVLTDITKKPSRWSRSKSSSNLQRSQSSDAVQSSAQAGSEPQLLTSVISKSDSADNVKQKDEASANANAKDSLKEKRPDKQTRRISFRRGLTSA